MNNAVVLLLVFVLTPLPGLAQENVRASSCKQDVFNAYRPLPKLTYDCPESLNDSDDKILNLPERTSAIKSLEQELASFADANWWRAGVDELDACEIHGQAGALSNEEREKLKDGDFWFRLFGDHKFRLVLTADPCYQTGYNGSNAFLLYRKGAKVFVTQLLDGYFSRIDNSVGIDSANLNGQTLIQISTANNMPPEFTNYYFAIDPGSNRAISKKIFRVGGRLTNKISTAMVFGEHGAHYVADAIIRRNHLVPVFSSYVDDYRGKIDDSGRKLRRVTYRWNGRFYSPAK